MTLPDRGSGEIVHLMTVEPESVAEAAVRPEQPDLRENPRRHLVQHSLRPKSSVSGPGKHGHCRDLLSAGPWRRTLEQLSCLSRDMSNRILRSAMFGNGIAHRQQLAHQATSSIFGRTPDDDTRLHGIERRAVSTAFSSSYVEVQRIAVQPPDMDHSAHLSPGPEPVAQPQALRASFEGPTSPI